MAKLHYKLTQETEDSLLRIERLYGRLEGQIVPQKLLLNLERTNLINSSFASNKIEGNTLSLLEVTNLLLGERMPVNHEEQDVKNYFEILKKLPEYKDKKLSIETILFFHKFLFEKQRPEIAGKIRNEVVVVGKKMIDGKLNIKHRPPDINPMLIQRRLINLLDYILEIKINPILKCGIFHHQYVYIHPFVDGNGRTGRLLTSLLFMKLGYKINKYFVLDDYFEMDKALYSDKLHTADEGDLSEWLEYFVTGVENSLASSLAKIDAGVKESKIKLRLTKNEKKTLDKTACFQFTFEFGK